MSNLGLQKALADQGIAMLRTPVGDKYVLEEMIRRNASFGGEQSGHVIFRDYATTGDGMLTALRVLEVLRETGRSLDELTATFQRYPQRLVNVRVRAKPPLGGNRNGEGSDHRRRGGVWQKAVASSFAIPVRSRWRG